MPRVQAQLVEWNDNRGFGFARLAGGSERIFVHISSLEDGQPRPRTGDELDFEVGPGRNGRPAAHGVHVLRQPDLAKLLPLHIVTAIMLFLLVQIVVILGRAPIDLVGIYVAMGSLAVWLYSRDKKAAQRGSWRISEARLIAVDLFGGVIGGLLAQQRFAHKKSKTSFQLRTFVVVVLHTIFLTGLGTGVISWDWMAHLIVAPFHA